MTTPHALQLDVVQRWMQSVIVHPGGVEAGIQSPAAQTEIKLAPDRIDDVIRRSHSLTSMERLEVYSNAYRARLLEVLIGEFPALVHAIREEVFVGLAGGYLEEHPPKSYTLAELGRSFPDYLARRRPARESEDGSPDWADFLVDVARLERIYSEVFDGPGIEGEATLAVETIQELSPEQWLVSRLITAPCLRLESFRFPVHEYASAVRHQQEVSTPDAKLTRLAISRRDFVVRRVPLAEDEYTVLTAFVAGRTVGEALEHLFSAASHPVEELAEDVNRWFRNWSAAGFFVGIYRD